jgi:hypothetical protein
MKTLFLIVAAMIGLWVFVVAFLAFGDLVDAVIPRTVQWVIFCVGLTWLACQ